MFIPVTIDLLSDIFRESNIRLIKVSRLKPHEKIDEKNLIEVKKSIIDNGLKSPIVVDKNTNTILDGHHRFKIFDELNIGVIPVFYVDYFDNKILVKSKNGDITKIDVLIIANSGKIFPSKSTKHLFLSNFGFVPISSITPKINLNVFELKQAKEGDNEIF